MNFFLFRMKLHNMGDIKKRNAFFVLRVFIFSVEKIMYICSRIMSRILAIDFGQKKSGIAVTDELQIISSPLTTVATKHLIDFLKDYLEKEEVEMVVIGEPKTMDNKASDSTKYIQPFIGRLKKALPGIKIDRMDERFTSRMAFQTMIDGGLGMKARRNKELVDSISASLILQSYMDYIKIRK